MRGRILREDRNGFVLMTDEGVEHLEGRTWHTQAETERLLGMMAPLHLAKIEAAKRASRRMVGGLYKRIRVEAGDKVQRAEIRFDEVAGCLRVPTGGSTRQTIVIVGDLVRSRLLSPREAARLMGLSDDFVLPANSMKRWPSRATASRSLRSDSWRSTSSSLFCRRQPKPTPQGEPSHDHSLSRLQRRPGRALELAAADDLP